MNNAQDYETSRTNGYTLHNRPSASFYAVVFRDTRVSRPRDVDMMVGGWFATKKSWFSCDDFFSLHCIKFAFSHFSCRFSVMTDHGGNGWWRVYLDEVVELVYLSLPSL